MTDHSGGQMITTDAEAVAEGMEPGDVWLKKISKARDDEKAWRKEAEKAVAIFEGDMDGLTKAGAKPISYNIYHSNVQTMVPAVYNSSPIPDIRRRYDDPDPQSKLAVDIIERALMYSIDQYEFDSVMVACVQSALTTGRGVVRVRYEPTLEPQAPPMPQQQAQPAPQPMPPMGPEGMPQQMGQDPAAMQQGMPHGQPPAPQPPEPPVELKSYEEVNCEVVRWNRFIRGPSQSWATMPWIAFEHDLTRDEITELAGKDRGEDVKLEGEHGDKHGDSAKPDAGVYKTAKVYEIWDKRRGIVFFLEDKKGSEPLKIEQDPLGLPGFFPVPRPIQPVSRETSMTPICPYTIYAPLVEELDVVTKRITKLVKQLRVRGIYDAGLKADLAALANSDDGTYLPAEDATRFAQGAGGLEKAIAHFPMEPTVLALKELYVQRDQIKQTIYEVTGLADIVRGASQASDTATAQQIKAQYAGLRIQSLQKEVARLARDIFRMKSAIFCGHFSDENLQVMTGLPVAQVSNIIRSEAMRSFRIDIETDSTIRGDVSRSLEQMTQFIQGTGQFVQAVGAMAESVPPLMAPMMDIYSAFARKFDLGKQAEDALDKMPQLVQQFMQDQAQKAQGPNPEQIKAEADAKAKQQDMQIKQQSAQFDLEHKTKLAQLDIESKQAAAQMELQHKKATQQMDMEHLQTTRAMEMQHKHEAHGADMENKRATTEFAMADREHGLRAKQDLHAMDTEKAEREAETETKVAAEIPKALESVAEAITTLRQDIKAIPAKIRQAKPEARA